MPTSNYKSVHQKLRAKIPAVSQRVLERSIGVAAEKLILRTPVRSGRHRGDWKVTVGGLQGGETGQLDPSGSATIAKAKADATQARLGLNVNLENSGPAIERLERGSSTQAPQGFLKITSVEMPAEIERIHQEEWSKRR